MKKFIMGYGSCIGWYSSFTSCGSKKADGKSFGKFIATDTVFRPFEYTNEKNDEFVGIDVDNSCCSC